MGEMSSPSLGDCSTGKKGIAAKIPPQDVIDVPQLYLDYITALGFPPSIDRVHYRWRVTHAYRVRSRTGHFQMASGVENQKGSPITCFPFVSKCE